MTVLVAMAGSHTAMRARVRSLDMVLFAGVIVAACVIGGVAAAATGGHIPAQNTMYDADTGRVLGNLTGASDSYYRLKVHPWYGWICIVFQQVLTNLFGLPASLAVPLLSVAIAAAGAGLLYAVLRRVDIAPFAAACHALLYCSSASFVYWSTLPETHMAGGVTTLIAVLLMTGSRPRSFLALAASFSMVVTNAAVWALEKVDFAALQRGWRTFIRANLAQAWRLVRPTLWGIGVVFAVWAPQWLFLHKRLGIPFNFLEEREFVAVGARTWDQSLNIFGLLPPGSVASVVIALAAIGVLVAALRILPRTKWFLALFPLFGLVLHTVYGSESAFLFSPNYLPLFVVVLALVMKKALPDWTPAAVLSVAALLLAFNLGAWNASLEQLSASGQMRTYDAAVHY
jgi:hypothetical protein